MRHAACKLSFLANATDTSEVTYRKQLVVRNSLLYPGISGLCIAITFDVSINVGINNFFTSVYTKYEPVTHSN